MTEKKQGRALCKDSLRFGTLLVLALLVTGNTFAPLAEAKTALPPTTTEIAPTTAVVATTTKTIIPPRPIVITAPTRPAGNTGGSSKPQSGGGFAEFGKIIQTFLPLVNTFSNLFKGGGSSSSGGVSGNTQSGGCSTCGTGSVNVNGGTKGNQTAQDFLGSSYGLAKTFGYLKPEDEAAMNQKLPQMSQQAYTAAKADFQSNPRDPRWSKNFEGTALSYAERYPTTPTPQQTTSSVTNTTVESTNGTSYQETPYKPLPGEAFPSQLTATASDGRPVPLYRDGVDVEGNPKYTSCLNGVCQNNTWVVALQGNGEIKVINNATGGGITIDDATTFRSSEKTYTLSTGKKGDEGEPGIEGGGGSFSGYPDFELPETPTPFLPEGYEVSMPVDSNGVPFFDPNENLYASWEDLQQFNQNPTNDYSSFFGPDGYTPEFDAMLTTETFYTAPENPLFTDWNEIYDVESYNPAWNPSDFETTDNFADYTPQEIGFEGYENFYSNEYDLGFVNDPYSTYDNPWEGVTSYTGSDLFNPDTTYDNFGANAFDFSPTDYYGNPYFEAPNDSYLDFDTSYTGFDGYSAAPSGWDFSSDYTAYNNFDTFGGYDDYSYTESYETPYQSGGYDWEDEFWNGDW